MKLKHYTNNAIDSIVLVNGSDEIVGAWTGAHAIREFYSTAGGDPSDWDANGDDWRPADGIDSLVATIAADGTLIPADNELMASRREFFELKTID